jgi:hypothetical protein
MSRAVTVTLLSGVILTSCLAGGGCGTRKPDLTWYNAQGQPIPEHWTTNADGKRVPDPHPYDRYGRPWVYDANGLLVPPAGSPSRSRSSSLWLWGGSGYRSTSSGTSYGHSSTSSISRGGFGSTGVSFSSSS